MFWGDEPGDCVFLDQPVPITDIKAAQKRVRSDKTKDAITRCEGDTSDDSPFFSLKFTEVGYPKYESLSCLHKCCGALENPGGKASSSER